ncbi:fumarate hydratase class I [Theileria orientalis]|uniref:fumarate hydratase n=1 Tax=Theileria orientalis TaxID=68886 RepID=A0A976MBI3_THEOR|nr:fumarate hydratase class I [Theileria orientalis]
MPIQFLNNRYLNFGIQACYKVLKSKRMLQNPCLGCKCNSTLSGASCTKEVKPAASVFHNNYVEVFAKKTPKSDVKYTRLDDLSSLLKTEESGLKRSDGSPVKFLHVPPEVLTGLTSVAFTEIMHFLRTEHLSQLRKVFDDPESSDNDRFVSMQLLKNACISAGKVLPGCQDTGTAIVIGKRGNDVFSENDAKAITKGVYDSYLTRNFRYSQMAPLSMFEEVNTKCNLPAQVEIYSQDGTEYEFLFIAKGGGSANKTFLYQQTKSVLNENSLISFLMDQIKTIGTSACPPYHLAIVIGGLSAEMTLKTVKLASCKYLDGLQTEGNEYGNAFRDLEFEQIILEKTKTIGIGAQFGGKYFCHDVRVIRLPRHGASCPIGIGVSCSADRQVLAKINPTGVYLEELEHDPAQFLPTMASESTAEEIKVDLTVGMEKVLEQLREYPVKTRVLLSGPLIVARDIAHAMIVEKMEKTNEIPSYFKEYPIYYAGPAKRPEGYVSGSFGPTTAGRMDVYAQKLMEKGASLVTLAKGNRSRGFVQACKKHGGIYLGSVGGPAALIAEDCIESVEVVDLEHLGMEAVHKIEVKDFPAFVVVDAKGNDFYGQWSS